MKNWTLALALGTAVTTSVIGTANPASAVRLTFGGGSYQVTGAAGGFNLTDFVNNTGQDVNDLHVTISYVNQKGNPVTLTNDFFFPLIGPGGKYEPPTQTTDGGNVTQGFGTFTVDQRWDGEDETLKDGGTYWTKDRKPVPEPLTILGSVAALGFGAYAERKRKPSNSLEKDNTEDS